MASNPTPPKRNKGQHYVPRLHLAEFVGDSPRGMVWTYDKATGAVRPSKPTETGKEGNFYSIRQADGQYFDGMDQWLTEIENKAVVGYRQLLAGTIPSGQIRMDFSTFVATLYFRSPGMIRSVAEAHGQFIDIMSQKTIEDPRSLKKFLDDYEAENGPLTPERRQELVDGLGDRSKFVIEVDQQAGLRIIGAADKVQDILFNMHWTVLEAVEGFFISSDGPVVRMSPPETYSPVYGDGGFANSKVEISLPLSPQKCLLITLR